MGRRKKMRPFAMGTQDREGTWVHGGPPKRMTKGLRRHLLKVERQNPQEAERQRGMVYA